MALKRKCSWCGKRADRLPIGYTCPTCHDGVICQEGSISYWAVNAAANKYESPVTSTNTQRDAIALLNEALTRLGELDDAGDWCGDHKLNEQVI